MIDVLQMFCLQSIHVSVDSIFQILKRPVGTYQISFDLDLKAPKKSKAGMCNRNISTEKSRLFCDVQNCLQIVGNFKIIVY